MDSVFVNLSFICNSKINTPDISPLYADMPRTSKTELLNVQVASQSLTRKCFVSALRLLTSVLFAVQLVPHFLLFVGDLAVYNGSQA